MVAAFEFSKPHLRDFFVLTEQCLYSSKLAYGKAAPPQNYNTPILLKLQCTLPVYTIGPRTIPPFPVRNPIHTARRAYYRAYTIGVFAYTPTHHVHRHRLHQCPPHKTLSRVPRIYPYPLALPTAFRIRRELCYETAMPGIPSAYPLSPPPVYRCGATTR